MNIEKSIASILERTIDPLCQQSISALTIKPIVTLEGNHLSLHLSAQLLFTRHRAALTRKTPFGRVSRVHH